MKRSFTKEKLRVFVRVFFRRALIQACLFPKQLFYRRVLSSNKPACGKAKCLQPCLFVGLGRIEIGASQIGVWPSPGLFSGVSYIEARSLSARIIIGDKTYINNNATIIADRAVIAIGDRCLIGPNFFVTDSDFHGLEVVNRLNGNYECASVAIGDDVFVGAGVKVFKGVSIGAGSVIAGGAVVVSDVEPNSVYAGNPAKKIKPLDG